MVGIPSPSPSFPQQIKNVTGNANIKIQNKNLFKFNNEIKTAGGTDLSYYNVDYSITNQILNINGTMSNTNTFILSNLDLEAGTYTISFDVLGGSVNNPLYVSVITENETKQITLENSNISSQIVATGKIQRIDIYIGIGRVFTNYQLRCQLEQGSTATSYVSHAEQNLPFTFAEGQFLADDEKLQDVGMYKEWKQVAFSGTTATLNDAKTNGAYFCNKKVAGNLVGQTLTFDEEVTNAVIQYELAEPDIIPYNETQASEYNAIKEAKTYNDITYITSESSELPPELEIQYWKERGAE